MLGSRTIRAGIPLTGTCVLETVDGHNHSYNLAAIDLPSQQVPHKFTSQDMISLYPDVFADHVGCFKPEQVKDIPFIHPPASPRLKQVPLKGRYAQAVTKQISSCIAQDIISEVT